jgi:glutaredoxin
MLAWSTLALLLCMTSSGGPALADHLGAATRPCTNIEIYTASGCPHCGRALEFLQQLQADYPQITVHNHDIRADTRAMVRFIAINEQAGEAHPGVPTLLICDQFFVGFEDADSTGATIKQLLGLTQAPAVQARGSNTFELPLFGTISVSSVGMPLFTLAIGLIDGFNPCAMWVLLVLLSLLVNLRDRKRLSLIAGTFVVISGAVYFAFMAAWLNLFLIIGISRIIQVGVGMVALIIGTIHIKDYFAFKKGVSLSIPDSAKPGLYQKMRSVVYAENLFAALLAVSVLALLVNMVELACTVGLPALYTQILASRAPDPIQHYGYLLLYNLAYIFDDTVMVIIAVFTLSSRRLQESEGRWLKLVSGSVIFAVGALLIAAPQWLI